MTNFATDNDSFSTMEAIYDSKSTSGKLPKSRMPTKPRVRIQKSQRHSPRVISKPLTEEEMEFCNYLSTLPDMDVLTNMTHVNEETDDSTEMGYFNLDEPYTVIYNSACVLYDYSHMMEEYNLEHTYNSYKTTNDEAYSDEDMEELWNAYEKFCWMCD
jgi:hypothetical protein